MQKRNDPLAQFAAARLALLAERDTIENRLQQIDAALGGKNAVLPVTAIPKRRGRGRKPARAHNKMNIREAVTKATAAKPLTVREIVEAVQKGGYKFTSKNPVNSVGAFLYAAGKKHFKRANGKFWPK